MTSVSYLKVNVPYRYKDDLFEEIKLLGVGVDNKWYVEQLANGVYQVELTRDYLSRIDYLESILDRWRENVPVIRYHIFIYDAENAWPRSIRINRDGKKIETRRQTKFGDGL